MAQFHLRRAVNGGMINEAAARIQTDMNKHLPPERQSTLQFSKGWLQKLQGRYGLKFYKSHGESGSANHLGLNNSIDYIKRVISSYNRKDIFHADEFGHCYKMALDKTIGPQRLPGKKKEKARLSYLACANADGSEKVPQMIIGKSARPRPFKKKTGKELGFDYYQNKKAWMTFSLFSDWLDRFDSYISSTGSERRVLLLVDNCSAHGTEYNIPDLDNVNVLFLPPNTTSVLQPMDAGVIASVKARYRKRQYERALDNIDSGETDIYRVDQLTSMQVIKDIWVTLPEEIIYNCWEHTGILEVSTGQLPTARLVSNEDINDVMDAATSLLPAPLSDRLTIEGLLNPVDEELCSETAVVSDVASVAVSFLNADEEGSYNDDEICVSVQNVSVIEQLKSIVIVKRCFEEDGTGNGPIIRALNSLQRELRTKLAGQAKQTLITDFFSCSG